MPQIPTDNRPLSLLGAGGSQPRATPMDFGAGIGQELQGMGQSLTGAANTIAALDMQKQNLDDVKYVNDATTRFQDFNSTWLAAPENSNDLNVDTKFYTQAKKMQQEYESAAPTSRAKQMLRRQLDDYVSSRYASASQHAAGLRSADLLRSAEDAGDSDIRAYTNEVVTPGTDATSNLISQVPKRIAQNNATLPPGLARQLNDKYTTDAALSVADRSPEAARKILNAGTLDGRQRFVVERAIKTAEEALNSLNSTVLQGMGENRMAQADLGAHPQEFSLGDISPLTSSSHAQHLVTQWNAHITASNKMWDMYDESKSWNGPEQVKFLSDFEERAKSDTANASLNARVLPMIVSRVSANIRQYYQDPSGYMLNNNPAVAAAQRRIDQFPPVPKDGQDPYRAERQQARVERDDLTLKYQNVPDQSFGEVGKKQHWVVPVANQRVMSEGEAEASVSRINSASPNDALGVIMSEVGQHPGREAIAFNNLVHIPGSTGLRGDYWMVYKNQTDPDVKDLIGALQHAKQLRDDMSSKDKMADFEKAIDGDPTFTVFAASVPADNYQREEVVAGYRNGLITYALAQVQAQPGMSPEAAIKKGVDKWINKTSAVISVGGKKMIIDRKVGDSRLSDPEIGDIGRRLSLAPQFLDAKKIATKDEWGRDHFPDITPGMTDAVVDAEMRRYRDDGYFKLAPDNQTATFYIRKRDGGAFEARDKNQKAFVLDMKNLPKFERVLVASGEGRFGAGAKAEWKTYGVDEFMGSTKWPISPKWLGGSSETRDQEVERLMNEALGGE